MSRVAVPKLLRDRAKSMRHEPTEAEKVLWRILRNRRLSMPKFRGQAPIPPYIVDFVCFEHRVIVEADSSQHAENANDKRRDAFLASEGFTIVRFWNHEILNDARVIEDAILARCGLPW